VSKRGVFVSIAFAAFPFGGLIGALTSSYVIPNFGWQFIFYIGRRRAASHRGGPRSLASRIAALPDGTQYSS
jgi:MFS family permease